jgi:hypothetical protein
MKTLNRVLLLAAAAWTCLAHDVRPLRILRSTPRTIHITADSDIHAASPSRQGTFAHLLLDDGSLLQLFFQIQGPSGSALDLTDLQCRDARGILHDLNLFTGQPACGAPPLTGTQQRTVFVHLAGFRSLGTPLSDIDLSRTIQLQEPPELNLVPPAPGSKTLRLRIASPEAAAIAQAIANKPGDVKVDVRLSPRDTIAPPNLMVTSATPAPSTPGADPQPVLTLSGALPRRPDPFTVIVTIPRALLPPAVAERLQPADPGLTGATRVSPIASSEQWLALDATFTSVVDRKNKRLVTTGGDERLTAGLFKLEASKEHWLHSFAGDGLFGAVAWRNRLKADVSTLNQADFDVPTQIAAGSDLELQMERGAREAFRGIHLTGGYRHESDRDLKFQLALARFGIRPVLPAVNQSRAYRSHAAKGHPITAVRLQPAFYFDYGGVVRDRAQRLIPNIEITDRISRTVTSLDFRLEIKRYLALSLYDEYTHIFSVDRRPNRNYLNAGLEIETGYLFGANFLGGIQNSILLKWQRGELAPVYKPVNAFSMGFKLTR